MTSPYLEREEKIVLMAKVLEAVDDLSNSGQRVLAYRYVGIPTEAICEYDSKAKDRETIRRSLFNMEARNASLGENQMANSILVDCETATAGSPASASAA